MLVYLASDHAGFDLKQKLALFLKEKGYEVFDCGPEVFAADDDYPDYVVPCAQKVAATQGGAGVVIGLSGQGEAMAANRVKGVRAAVYYGGPEEILTLSRQHNNANILSLGAKFLTDEAAEQAVLLWLRYDFSGEERHARRTAKLDTVHN